MVDGAEAKTMSQTSISTLRSEIERADLHLAKLNEVAKGNGTNFPARSANQRDEGQQRRASKCAVGSLHRGQKRRAEGSLGTEEDTRKANSESGFAFNAKGNAEEHAKAMPRFEEPLSQHSLG